MAQSVTELMLRRAFSMAGKGQPPGVSQNADTGILSVFLEDSGGGIRKRATRTEIPRWGAEANKRGTGGEKGRSAALHRKFGLNGPLTNYPIRAGLE